MPSPRRGTIRRYAAARSWCAERVSGGVKILHIVHSLQIGGMENGVVNLINRLPPGSFQHAVCCISRSGPMADRIRRGDVEIWEIGKTGRDYLLPVKLSKLIRRLRPDIVHTRNWSAVDGIVAARLAGVPAVIHGEHGRDISDPTGSRWHRNAIRKGLGRWVHRFVSVSDDLARWLVGTVGIPAHKVVRIANGVDAEKFRPPPDKARAKRNMGLAPEAFVVGTVGRLDPVKDLHTLLAAFAGLVREAADAQLLVAGSGPCFADLKRSAAELGVHGRVRFLGERKDIPAVLQAMDVFVLPSVAEGLSNTLLEAMATGLPVAATRVGGNPDAVLDGRTGVLWEPGDAAALQRVLLRYRRDAFLREAHGEAGRSRVLREFSLDRMVQAYEALYTDTARRYGAPVKVRRAGTATGTGLTEHRKWRDTARNSLSSKRIF